MLKEGDTVAKRDAMRTFFAQHDYRNGHVTIDNSDWVVDQRLTARLKKDANADVKPYRDFYLEHVWDARRVLRFPGETSTRASGEAYYAGALQSIKRAFPERPDLYVQVKRLAAD